MAKSRDAFRTISEVSDVLETPAHVLRFWESKFSQIKPVKRAGGRRYFRPDDVALLSGIKHLLHEQGLTIKGAQKLLREQGVKHVMEIGEGAAPSQPAMMAQPPVAVAPDTTVQAVADIIDAEEEDTSQPDMFAPDAEPSPARVTTRLEIVGARAVPDPAPTTEPIAAAPPATTPTDDFTDLDIPTTPAANVTPLSSIGRPKPVLPANPAPPSDMPARCLAYAVTADPARITAKAAEIAPLLDRLGKLRDEMRHPW